MREQPLVFLVASLLLASCATGPALTETSAPSTESPTATPTQKAEPTSVPTQTEEPSTISDILVGIDRCSYDESPDYLNVDGWVTNNSDHTITYAEARLTVLVLGSVADVATQVVVGDSPLSLGPGDFRPGETAKWRGAAFWDIPSIDECRAELTFVEP
jgi:hypothetical protein